MWAGPIGGPAHIQQIEREMLEMHPLFARKRRIQAEHDIEDALTAMGRRFGVPVVPPQRTHQTDLQSVFRLEALAQFAKDIQAGCSDTLVKLQGQLAEAEAALKVSGKPKK